MTAARLSLLYLLTYLLAGGIGLLAAPSVALGLLGAEHAYSVPIVQLAGAFMIGLAAIVAQIIRHRLDVLYRTTIAVRLFFIAVLAYLYARTGDRLFIMLLTIVGSGVALTVLGVVRDRMLPAQARP